MGEANQNEVVSHHGHSPWERRIKMKLFLIIATVLGTFACIVTAKYATARATLPEDIRKDDCPGTYCITDFFEGCCSYAGFVCCEETTRGFCAYEAKYCPPSNLDGDTYTGHIEARTG